MPGLLRRLISTRPQTLERDVVTLTGEQGQQIENGPEGEERAKNGGWILMGHEFEDGDLQDAYAARDMTENGCG